MAAGPNRLEPDPEVTKVAFTLTLTIVGSVLLSACSGGQTTAQRVSAWVSATGLDSGIAQIRADAANVAKVEPHGSAGAIRTNCAVLDLDTENANQNLPSPYQQLTTDLSNAYAAEIQAAQDCYHGAGKSAELIARGQIAQSAADSDISLALSLVTQLTHGANS
jgi:outer membrane murein-binding lipoprotein Lpp